MTDRRRRLRRWAGDRLRGLVRISTADVAGDLHAQTDAVIARLSDLAAEVAATRRDVAATRDHVTAHQDQLRSVSQSLKYLALSTVSRADAPQPDLTAYEMRIFSQNGEDGVLLEILRRIGSHSKRFLEIGAQAAEANCVALAALLGWDGTFVEADHERAEHLRRTHGIHGRVAVVESFVTRESVNELVGADALDVFSLDIDGNDYWVWQALESVMPRVVIIEYNAKLDPRRALVQPYDPQWIWRRDDAFGASRAAMVQLGITKGYRLVHAETSGANLFFVRDDLAADQFLATEEVVIRTPNYFLAAESHPEASDVLEYVDVDARPDQESNAPS